MNKSDLPQWQKDKLDVYLEEHYNGTAEYVDWEVAKKELFAKYGINEETLKK